MGIPGAERSERKSRACFPRKKKWGGGRVFPIGRQLRVVSLVPLKRPTRDSDIVSVPSASPREREGNYEVRPRGQFPCPEDSANYLLSYLSFLLFPPHSALLLCVSVRARVCSCDSVTSCISVSVFFFGFFLFFSTRFFMWPSADVVLPRVSRWGLLPLV